MATGYELGRLYERGTRREEEIVEALSTLSVASEEAAGLPWERVTPRRYTRRLSLATLIKGS